MSILSDEQFRDELMRAHSIGYSVFTLPSRNSARRARDAINKKDGAETWTIARRTDSHGEVVKGSWYLKRTDTPHLMILEI